MKRMVPYCSALVALALLLGIAWIGGAVANDRSGPRIELNEERFDFGRVAAGERPVHVFEIRNTGDEVLEINKVQST